MVCCNHMDDAGGVGNLCGGREAARVAETLNGDIVDGMPFDDVGQFVSNRSEPCSERLTWLGVDAARLNRSRGSRSGDDPVPAASRARVDPQRYNIGQEIPTFTVLL